MFGSPVLLHPLEKLRTPEALDIFYRWVVVEGHNL
jgi:hypothetical protein